MLFQSLRAEAGPTEPPGALRYPAREGSPRRWPRWRGWGCLPVTLPAAVPEFPASLGALLPELPSEAPLARRPSLVRTVPRALCTIVSPPRTVLRFVFFSVLGPHLLVVRAYPGPFAPGRLWEPERTLDWTRVSECKAGHLPAVLSLRPCPWAVLLAWYRGDEGHS